METRHRERYPTALDQSPPAALRVDPDVARHLADQAELLRIGRAIAADADPRAVLAEIARAGIGIPGAECCGIYLWDDETAEFEVGWEATIPARPDALAPGTRLPAADWPTTVAALRDRRPFNLRVDDPDLSERERRRYAGVGAGGVLGLPLLDGAGCLGYLKLFTREPRPFSPREVRFGAELAAQAALAIRNATLLADAHRRVEEQAALMRVAQAAISSLNLSEVLREIAVASIGVADAECCGIQLWHPAADEVETVAEETIPDWPGVHEPGTRFPLTEWPATRRVLEGRTPVRLAPTDDGLSAAEREHLSNDAIQSLLMVPLLIGDACLGVLLLYARQPRAFDARAERLALEVAALTSLAVQNARLLDEARRHTAEQAALLRVTQAFGSNGGIRQVLAEVARATLGIAGAEGCEIAILHRDAGQIEILAEERVADWPTSHRPGARVSLVDWPSTRAALAAGEPRAFLVDDPELRARERAAYQADGTQSALIVPLMLGRECLGHLALYSRQRVRFGEQALRFGQDLAVQAAQAIDRTRLFEAIRRRADTDGLTGLLNHRAIQERLDHDLALARIRRNGLAVVLVDLDDFKLFNDTHGHLVGDRVLTEVAELLRAAVRSGDRVARYGGDEFLLVLPNADAIAAHEVAARLLDRAERTAIRVGDLALPIRLSVGIATFPRDGQSRQALIAFADASMYAAKDAGGGQVGFINGLTRSLETTPFGALSGLVRAVDRKDRYTKVHSDLVTELAVGFGRSLGLPTSRLEALDIAGQLHDVGKIAVPDAILRKPGNLSPDEEAEIRQHVVFSALMVQGVPHLDDVRAAIAHHHERWDGRGYPHAARGEEIPLLGRIMALADAFAAMIHDRPYRKGRSLDQAVSELRAGAGIQFDPTLVESFIAYVTSDAGRATIPAILGPGRRKGLPGARPAALDGAGPLRVAAGD